MPCIRFNNAIVTIPHFGKVRVNGKWQHFTFCEWTGPMLLNKDGSDRKRYPGFRSPFWPAFSRWVRRRFPRRNEGKTLVKLEDGPEVKP